MCDLRTKNGSSMCVTIAFVIQSEYSTIDISLTRSHEICHKKKTTTKKNSRLLFVAVQSVVRTPDNSPQGFPSPNRFAGSCAHISRSHPADSPPAAVINPLVFPSLRHPKQVKKSSSESQRSVPVTSGSACVWVYCRTIQVFM